MQYKTGDYTPQELRRYAIGGAEDLTAEERDAPDEERRETVELCARFDFYTKAEKRTRAVFSSDAEYSYYLLCLRELAQAMARRQLLRIRLLRQNVEREKAAEQ